ncbi:preprotein translocase subunit YajC [Campylobacter sp.]|uniref:preprotein translocase subunit YajC n=1 Tax=Campylobacter sp. TaxID=205 RepID=UPI002A75FA6C|nr:preprotein translocase subunit YajC [Campylobacter sp.]MDY2763196.1 preprotein translocase subunit YajC [Campylobacter sp.]
MQGDLLSSLLPLVVLVLIFWFLVIRPQQMQAKKHKEMLNALTKGDKIITNGGLVAEVVNAEGDFIKVKLNDDVIVRLDRAFVAKKYEDTVAEVKK